MSFKERVKLWIVEDNSMYAKALSFALSEMSTIDCKEIFSTAEDAIEQLAKDPTQVELLLLDIELPGITGIEAIQKLLELQPDLKIMILSQHNEMSYVVDAIAEGAVGYYLKSNSHDQLQQAISTILSDDAAIDPRLTKYLLQEVKHKKTDSPKYDLTDREQQALDYLVKGFSKKEISKELHISYHTVDKHIRTLYKKLGVNNVSSAVAKAMQV